MLRASSLLASSTLAVLLLTAGTSPAGEFSPQVLKLPYPPDAYDLEFTAWSEDITYNSQSPLKSLGAFYLEEMRERGWELDKDEVEIDDDSIELVFTHGEHEVDLRISQWSKEVKVRIDGDELDFAGVDDPASIAAAGLPVPPAVRFFHTQLETPADARKPDFDADDVTVISPQGLQEAYDFYCDQVRKLGFRESRRPIITDTRRYTEFKQGGAEVSVNVFTHDAGSRAVLGYEDSRPTPRKPPLAAVASLPIGNPVEAMEAEVAAETAMNKTPVSVADNRGQAVVTYGGKKYTFNNVACFQTKDRGGYATEVVFASKPIPLGQLQQLLAAEDDPSLWDLYDDFQSPDYLILQLGKFESVSFSVPGVGIGGKQPADYTNQMKVEDGRVRGKWTMAAETVLSRKMSFTAEIDAALLTPTTRITSMPTESAAAPAAPPIPGFKDADIPMPDGVEDLSRTGSNFRKEYTATVAKPWPEVSKFFQRELPKEGWTLVTINDGRLTFRTPQRELTAVVKPAGSGTSILVVTREKSLAEKEGILPERGKARLVLGNAHTRPVVFTIGKQDYQLKAGQGGRDPQDALNYTVGPGTYTVVIKIPGEAPQTEKLKLEEGSTWGIIALPTGGYLPMQLY
ncbi:hypothetical protein KOR34_09930 [Posidoniimonas corsicana]|uniref:Uncharacterized protein n=1 Tax=Posidoniimonas corsicana TaxID=1938618 RepID=A0A5C5VBT6_9BACT|nr:hypothetical protein [Posidoniimonas corsicana]TWT36094.1 hypothetical protein KOR34_09930 [Posidoniimonas corsicana]